MKPTALPAQDITKALNSLSSMLKAHCPSTRLKRSQVISSLPCDADLSAMATCRVLADSLSFLPGEALAGRFALLGRNSPRGSRIFIWLWRLLLLGEADLLVVHVSVVNRKSEADAAVMGRSDVDAAVMGRSPTGC
eukprot:FR740632.1.p2 GENE.FR740632.1~~FR740632.1.p2  ORF type:complete len:136 (+),score=9.46 FR740632.1:242-649(+)